MTTLPDLEREASTARAPGVRAWLQSIARRAYAAGQHDELASREDSRRRAVRFASTVDDHGARI